MKNDTHGVLLAMSLKTGQKVRLRRPKKTHPWRRGRKPYNGRGIIEAIREVQPSENAPDGKIYSVRLSKLTVKEYTALELILVDKTE